MRGVVFIGGGGPDPARCRALAEGAGMIVAADAGLEAAEAAGLVPDWIVGDMDSLDDPRRLDRCPADRVLRYPPDKDYTDTELALDLAWKRGCDEVALVGGGGGRLDHILALRALFDRERRPARWVTGGADVYALDAGGDLALSADKPGGLVSVFPTGDGPWQAASEGLRWALDGVPWTRGSAGVSNRAVNGAFSVKSIRGGFMVVIQRETDGGGRGGAAPGARVLDCAAIAARVRAGAAARAGRLPTPPCLAVVLVGEDPASVSYVTAKSKALAEAGMTSRDLRLPAGTTEEALLDLVARLNADPGVHGILVQLPLPGHIRRDRVIAAISPAKDVDGLNPVSLGNLVLGRPSFTPCTPAGVLRLLREAGVPTAGAHAVILGRSELVGRPLANLFMSRDYNATVTVCHTGTVDVAGITRRADIVVAAVGRPGLVTADMVKPGATVIDVGVNRVADPSRKRGFRLVGDVDFDGVRAVAGIVTPVPGGVGPMTIAMLLENVVLAAERAAGRAP